MNKGAFHGEELYRALRDRRTVAPLIARDPSLTIADAYAISLDALARRRADGERVVGKKIGVTSKAVQDMLGGHQPDFGFLTDRMWVPNVDGVAEIDIAARGLIQPRAEAEIAFILKSQLVGPGVTAADVIAATQSIAPCFEIVDSRIDDWKIKIVDTVADNASCGVYVIGARDDNWVTARPFWNQHAYYVTNVDSDYEVGYGTPNYAPYAKDDYNSFRQQAPGKTGALQASNLRVKAQELCQEGCGAVTVRFQVENQSKAIAADKTVPLALYGVSAAGKASLIDDLTLGVDLGPGEITDTYELTVGPSVWTKFESFVVVVDDPAISGLKNGMSQECDETDNAAKIPLVEVCP